MFLCLSHMNIDISHNVHAHALSLSSKLRARLQYIVRTPQRASHFFPVWLHQHEKEKPAHLLQSSKTVSADLQVELRELELAQLL